MAAPAAITMLVQAAHQIITLYFVSRIGADAVAGVSAAGTTGFVVGALTQIVNVGTAALVAHSAGRKDLRDISTLLHQALGLGLVCALATVCIVGGLAPIYMSALSKEPAVVEQGVGFLWWISPGFAVLFPMTALMATLRGMGVVKAPMLIFTLTIILDALFAAVLIPGRGFIPAMGVEGAGLATTLSFTIGLILMLVYLRRTERDIVIRRELLPPLLAIWRRIVAVGSPAAAELVLMFLSMAMVYLVIRDQGASTQAGFGIGFRVLQVVILPGLSVTLAAVPIAGQNFGAGNTARVLEVFKTTTILSSIIMLITTLLVHWYPQALLSLFTTDDASAATATSFLRIISWTLVAQGIVYTCAFMFQALGNTMPALMSAAARFVVFSIPALWLSWQPGFHTDQVWYLWTASIAVQAIVSLWLIQVEFKRKLHRTPPRESNNPTSSTHPDSSYVPDSRTHIDPTKTL